MPQSVRPGPSLQNLVGLAGFEPAILCSQSRWVKPLPYSPSMTYQPSIEPPGSLFQATPGPMPYSEYSGILPGKGRVPGMCIGSLLSTKLSCALFGIFGTIPGMTLSRTSWSGQAADWCQL